LEVAASAVREGGGYEVSNAAWEVGSTYEVWVLVATGAYEKVAS
jgi:hypothetical protein